MNNREPLKGSIDLVKLNPNSRKKQIVKFPLSKANELTVRKFYKTENNLSTNASEEKIFNSLGIHTKKTAYKVLAELYNIYVNTENEKIDRKRLINKKQKYENNKIAKEFIKSIILFNNYDTIKPLKVKNRKPVIKFEKLSGYVSNWFKKNPNQMLSLKLGSTKADVILPLKFKCLAHFENWLKRINDEDGKELNSAGQMIEEDMNDKKLFTDSVVIEETKSISGGCNKHKAGDKKIKSSFYNYTLHNPCSMNNNCLFHCIQKISNLCINSLNIRKHFSIPTNTPISVNNAWLILKYLKLDDIEIIDYDTNEILSSDIKYILLKDDHFYVVESFEENNRKEIRTKRGLLTFDFETRQTDKFHYIKASNKKSYILKDSICCVYYKNYKVETTNHFCLTTNTEKSSARQFIDWLNIQAKEKKTYNVLAHNGGKFDFYFFIASLTDKEILECDIQMRGTTVIGINYRGNLFKDSCCFITNSLSNISESYKIEHGKITEMEINGKTLTSSQLCFYKPELSFNSFMELENNDTEFWTQYVKYCLYDCIALYEIWVKFTECVNSLIHKINPFLLQKCPLMASSTIGSHSKKIIVEINKFKGKTNSYKQGLENFLGVSVDDGKRQVDSDKYKFLCNFKRGGISHCNKMGKHTTGVVDVDIASQYPASLIYGYAPTGYSSWTNEYDKEKKGFYLINNIVFKDDQQLFKPVAKSILNTSLNWATNDFNELYIDSYMLDYVIQNHGLKSFTVVKGLVSDREVLLSKLFGSYINTFYEEKKLQDHYKNTKDELYNPALRETIKLYTNSLTGKLVEDPSIHFSLAFDDESKKMINGVGVSKVFNTEKFNDWLVAGIMVYSYSKRLLFQYIDCLPNKSDSVIHVETDGIFFSLNDLDTFKENLSKYEGEYPCMLGDNLGNLKIDKTTKSGDIDYFLGKKFYQFGSAYRIKGIPQSTIDEEGNKIQLVDVDLYESVFRGESITKEFQTLRKSFFGTKTEISSHKLSRVVRPNGKYSVYE